LLRIKFVPNMNFWDEPQPDPERIAEKWFDDQPGESPSLYEAASHAEEVEAAAALSLTNLAKRIEVGYLGRIEWGDLAAVGIPASDARPGNTGVVAVDFRHREIPGEREPIFKLLRHIWGRVRRGEDRFRWVGKQMQRAAMERFLEAGPQFVIEEAKRCCRRKLAEQAGGRRPLGSTIRDELQAAPPAIPEYRIRSLAEAKWLARLGAGLVGNAEQDWLSAEKELRQLYPIFLTTPRSNAG
jgi:hypothetical protein